MTTMTVTLLVALCIAAQMGGGANGVDIKRRMEEAASADRAADPSFSSTAPSSSSSLTVRPGRGVRQRMQAAEASSDVPPQPKNQGPLWKGLVRRWATGKISAGDLQQLAAEAMGQGASGMGDMASIGTYGTNPNIVIGP